MHLNKLFNSNKFLLFLFGGLSVFFITILLLSDGYVGGADNMTHYRYSRYAFQHPEFFLWHWGKPIYTILTSPFAQFGFIGVQIFNIICGLLSAYFSFRIVKELKFSNTWLTVILICFTPIYTVVMISGMTEILFSLIAIFSIFLFIKNKYALSAIVVSFLPLARTEGIFIIGVIGLSLLIYKKYKVIPLLLSGFILFSIIGGFYYNDFWWLITKMPYNGYKVYGTGKLLYFANTSPRYFGVIITALASIGVLRIIYCTLLKNSLYQKVFLIIFLPFFAFFSAHSLMWFTGYGNSAGFHRYMAGVVPILGIIALIGVDLIIKTSRLLISKINPFLEENKIFDWLSSVKVLKPILKYLIVSVSLVFIFIAPFKSYTIPVPYDHAQVVIKSFSEWFKESDYKDNKIYYYHPDIPYFLDRNPYDENICRVLIYNNNNPHEKIEPGSLILWDSYFSEINGLKLETIENDSLLKELNIFGDTNIVVFERLP